MANLSSQQKQIVFAEESKIIVLAAAGSGKTRCIAERLKYLLESGSDPAKVVAITFTNMAAEEIYERVGHPKGLFVGTIHSYANYLLLSAGIPTNQYLDDEEFDVLFEEVKAHPECIKPVDHLLLDESQDSNEQQFEFILDMINPKNYMLVGDFRQSIYRFNGARPDIVLSMTKEPDVKVYTLDENYRCGSKIIDFARRIIRLCGSDYEDRSIPARQVGGNVYEMEYNIPKIINLVKDKTAYNEWFVLARTNAQVNAIANAFTKAGIPNETFKKAQLTNNELKRRIKENTVKIITIHTAKGLEAPNVIVVGAQFYNLEEKCISYVAATRARNTLIWTKTPRKKYF